MPESDCIYAICAAQKHSLVGNSCKIYFHIKRIFSYIKCRTGSFRYSRWNFFQGEEEEEVIESVEEILEKLKEAIIETVGGNDQDIEVIAEQVNQTDEGMEQVTTASEGKDEDDDDEEVSYASSFVFSIYERFFLE